MKRSIFILFVLITNFNLLWSQKINDSVSFVSRFTKIKETNYRNNLFTTYTVPIECKLSNKKDIIINVKCEKNNSNRTVVLPESNIVIKKDTKEKLLTFIVQNDSLVNKEPEFFTLILSSEDTIYSEINSHVIEIEEYNDIYIPENPYRFALGTNFDFADGIKPQSFYAEISTFQPNLISLNRSVNKRSFKTLGIYGGIYQNRNLSPDSNSVSIVSFNSLNINSDTIGVREVFKRKPEVVLNNIGFYFGATFHLYESFQNDLRFNTYLSLHTELIHQQRITKYSYQTTSIDTISLSLSQLPNRPPSVDKIKSKNEISNLYYLGMGLPIRINTEKVELNFRPTLGFSWITREEVFGFYLFQFSIIENKYGVCIGGEYRGNFGQKETLISINLSKMFDLSKLIEYK